jgi:hypothetical protein
MAGSCAQPRPEVSMSCGCSDILMRYDCALQAGGPWRPQCPAHAGQHRAARLPCCAAGRSIVPVHIACSALRHAQFIQCPVPTSVPLHRRVLPALRMPTLLKEPHWQQPARASAWHSCSSCPLRRVLCSFCALSLCYRCCCVPTTTCSMTHSMVHCNAERAHSTAAAASARTSRPAAAAAAAAAD